MTTKFEERNSSEISDHPEYLGNKAPPKIPKEKYKDDSPNALSPRKKNNSTESQASTMINDSGFEDEKDVEASFIQRNIKTLEFTQDKLSFPIAKGQIVAQAKFIEPIDSIDQPKAIMFLDFDNTIVVNHMNNYLRTTVKAEIKAKSDNLADIKAAKESNRKIKKNISVTIQNTVASYITVENPPNIENLAKQVKDRMGIRDEDKEISSVIERNTAIEIAKLTQASNQNDNSFNQGGEIRLEFLTADLIEEKHVNNFLKQKGGFRNKEELKTFIKDIQTEGTQVMVCSHNFAPNAIDIAMHKLLENEADKIGIITSSDFAARLKYKKDFMLEYVCQDYYKNADLQGILIDDKEQNVLNIQKGSNGKFKGVHAPKGAAKYLDKAKEELRQITIPELKNTVDEQLSEEEIYSGTDIILEKKIPSSTQQKHTRLLNRIGNILSSIPNKIVNFFTITIFNLLNSRTNTDISENNHIQLTTTHNPELATYKSATEKDLYEYQTLENAVHNSQENLKRIQVLENNLVDRYLELDNLKGRNVDQIFEYSNIENGLGKEYLNKILESRRINPSNTTEHKLP